MEKVVLSKGYEYELVPDAVATGNDSVSVTFKPGVDTVETLEGKWAGNDNIKIVIGEDEIRNFSGYTVVKSVTKINDYVIHVITIVEVSAATDIAGATVVVDKDAFVAKIPSAGIYSFVYSAAESGWKFEDAVVSLADYGITFTGAPSDNGCINVTETRTSQEEKATVCVVTCAKPDLTARMADAEDSIEDLINTVLG